MRRPGLWGEEGGAVRWVPGWRLRAHVALVLHGPSCSSCRALAQRAARQEPAWAMWGVGLVGVREQPEPLVELARQLYDPAGRTRAEWDPNADAVVLVFDRRGEAAATWVLRHPTLPDWQQLEATVRWVGVQEPECGTCVPEPPWHFPEGQEAVWRST